MFWNEDSERTIPATPRRRADARKQGYLPSSAGVHAALMWAGVALLLIAQGPSLIRACGRQCWQVLTSDPVLRADELAGAQLLNNSLLVPVVVALVSLWLLSAVCQWLQVGFVWVPGNARPRWNRVSSGEALRRLLSGTSLVRAGLWLLKLFAMSGVIVFVLFFHADQLITWPTQPPERIGGQWGKLLASFAMWTCGVLLALAAIEHGWQRWRFERTLRMTPEEVRTEQQEDRAARAGRSVGRRQFSKGAVVPEAAGLRGIERI